MLPNLTLFNVEIFSKAGVITPRRPRSSKFSSPSPIQGAAWAPAIGGRDVVAIAKTGSGKTLGYLAPAIRLIDRDPELLVRTQPTALVLAPTRELAAQIFEAARAFGGAAARAAVAYGGAPGAPQLAALRAGVGVLVATPGRCADFLDDASAPLALGGATCVVLDEADRMLDMGFEPQLRAITAHMRTDRQTLMFSATWPAEVQALAKRVHTAGEAIVVEVGGALLEGGKANERISQKVRRCEP